MIRLASLFTTTFVYTLNQKKLLHACIREFLGARQVNVIYTVFLNVQTCAFLLQSQSSV